MRTRSQARRRRQPQVRQTSVESSNLEKPDNPPIVTMADNRTMAQLLEAPTEGYEDAIVIPEITANNFEIKHGLLNLVQNKQFFGNDKEDPHAHFRILHFSRITFYDEERNPNTSVRVGSGILSHISALSSQHYHHSQTIITTHEPNRLRGEIILSSRHFEAITRTLKDHLISDRVTSGCAIDELAIEHIRNKLLDPLSKGIRTLHK
ncbi:hypothetical protein Tco_0598223 [Tanacetum coccineum]